MSDKLFLLLVFSLLFVASIGPIEDRFYGGKIDISLTENDEVIRLKARYPADMAQSIHDFIRGHFGMTNLPDLKSVEISHYQTPDKSMSFHFTSRDGYLKISLLRKRNNPVACDKIRSAAGGLKKILAGN